MHGQKQTICLFLLKGEAFLCLSTDIVCVLARSSYTDKYACYIMSCYVSMFSKISTWFGIFMFETFKRLNRRIQLVNWVYWFMIKVEVYAVVLVTLTTNQVVALKNIHVAYIDLRFNLAFYQWIFCNIFFTSNRTQHAR